MEKLITYAYMRAETDMSQNIDDSRLDKPINRAQDQLRGILGEGFYNDLLTKFTDNTMTVAYNNLLEPYLSQYLAWQAYEFWLPKANVQDTATGLRVYKEDSSDPASEKTMGELIRDTKQSTQFYKGLLLGYLQTNSSNYPLYNTSGCGSGERMSAPFSITKIGGRSNYHGRKYR